MHWSWSLIIIAFIVGLALGWSISLSINPQTAPIGNIGLSISIIALVIAMIDLYKRLSEEIVLQFGGVTRHNNGNYYLTIVNKKGKGKAKNAEGHLTLKDKFNYAPTVWADGLQRYLDIGEHQDLLLFRLENDLILFPSAYPANNGGYLNNEYSYNDCVNKNLKVEISFDNGSFRKPYDKTISEIVRDAKPIN
jgi:hypothetical protein